MILRHLLVFLIATGGLFAAGKIEVTGLTLMQYDAKGEPVRRLKAARAVGPPDSAQLQQGEVEFFRRPQSSLSPDVSTPWARLTFPLAQYSALEKSVLGPGPIRLVTTEAQLNGRRFDYRLDSNRLVLSEEVVLSAQGAIVRSPRAEVQLADGPHGNDPVVDRAELSGGVVVTGLVFKGKAIDRVEAPSITYFGRTATLQLHPPVLAWSGGARTELSGETLTYQLEPSP
jgi:hypothetical protein